jgi:hypothetical protein
MISTRQRLKADCLVFVFSLLHTVSGLLLRFALGLRECAMSRKTAAIRAVRAVQAEEGEG